MMGARKMREEDVSLHEQAAKLALARSERLQDDDASVAQFVKRSLLHRNAWEDAVHALARIETLKDDDAFAPLRAEALRTRPGRHRINPALRIAASACALAVLGGAGLFYLRQTAVPPQVAATVASAETLYRTHRGERQTITLTDGSQVVLDASSALRVRYSSRVRALNLLSGQALFRVAKHQARPFEVDAGDQRVTATGTVFDVRYEPGRVKVSLLEGTVRVERVERAGSPRSAPAAILLNAGQSVEQHAGEIRLAQINPRQAQSWTTGVLDFDGMTLADAAAEMNRYSERKLLIAGAEAKAMTISGAFKPGDTERFARTMTEVFPLRLRALLNGSLILTADRRK